MKTAKKDNRQKTDTRLCPPGIEIVPEMDMFAVETTHGDGRRYVALLGRRIEADAYIGTARELTRNEKPRKRYRRRPIRWEFADGK